tara:strand:- start:4927 stop:5232 length:306 start_codon:yes stop_codon:yes gene_type:complete
MKRGIFNKYVDYVCQEMNITREQMFSKNRAAKISTARFLLYSICYQRPMTIVQIVDLMAENGYDIARTGVEYGIQKLENSGDVDVDYFIETAIRECSLQTA